MTDKPDRGDLEKRVAMITGAGRNIGRAIALELASGGADVVILACDNRQEAEGVAKEVRSLGRCALVGVADVRNKQAAGRVIEEAREALGPVTALVNNAAVRREAPFLELSSEEWCEVVDVILDGAFVCSRAVLSGILKVGWGRIANIAGLTEQTGAVHRAHAVAGKDGLIGLTKALALEYAADNTTVNAASPSLIDTTREGVEPRHYSGRSIPVRRCGKLGEVAAMLCFLVSDETSFVTGQTLNINGGLHL